MWHKGVMKIRTLLSLLLLALAAACGGSREEPPTIPGSGTAEAATPENRDLPEGEGKTVLLDVEGMT